MGRFLIACTAFSLAASALAHGLAGEVPQPPQKITPDANAQALDIRQGDEVEVKKEALSGVKKAQDGKGTSHGKNNKIAEKPEKESNSREAQNCDIQDTQASCRNH